MVRDTMNYSESRLAHAKRIIADADARAMQKEYEKLRENLYQLTCDYIRHISSVDDSHLDKEQLELKNKKQAHASKLFSAVCVGDSDIPAAVNHFYSELDKAETQLKQHRDPEWQRYVKNALIFAGILLTGILPGLIALAIYVNKKTDTPSSLKSYSFWKSRGENMVDVANEYRDMSPCI